MYFCTFAQFILPLFSLFLHSSKIYIFRPIIIGFWKCININYFIMQKKWTPFYLLPKFVYCLKTPYGLIYCFLLTKKEKKLKWKLEKCVKSWRHGNSQWYSIHRHCKNACHSHLLRQTLKVCFDCAERGHLFKTDFFLGPLWPCLLQCILQGKRQAPSDQKQILSLPLFWPSQPTTQLQHPLGTLVFLSVTTKLCLWDTTGSFAMSLNVVFLLHKRCGHTFNLYC